MCSLESKPPQRSEPNGIYDMVLDIVVSSLWNRDSDFTSKLDEKLWEILVDQTSLARSCWYVGLVWRANLTRRGQPRNPHPEHA